MNSKPLRCALYARYSSDSQREASIDDQLRKCRDYASANDWVVAEDQVYTDRALSGTGSDRPALTRLLNVAFSRGVAAFDVVLVDDTSRLSRDMGESIRINQRLQFEGVRLVAVSQGIDSNSEQSDIMFTVHGLVDSLYIKELAKKTHRGLEGNALKGLHTGGKCFGYDIMDAPEDRRQYRINESEAAIVRRIFDMAAQGLSLKRIAKET